MRGTVMQSSTGTVQSVPGEKLADVANELAASESPYRFVSVPLSVDARGWVVSRGRCRNSSVNPSEPARYCVRMSLDHVEKAHVLARLDRIHRLLNELERMVATTADRQRIRDRIRREVEATKDAIRVLGTHDPIETRDRLTPESGVDTV